MLAAVDDGTGRCVLSVDRDDWDLQSTLILATHLEFVRQQEGRAVGLTTRNGMRRMDFERLGFNNRS